MDLKLWGIVGWKNTGKTGLVARLVTEFTGRGISVSTIKHAHHAADVDHPGTDSYAHRQAGASEVILATPARVAIMQELRDAPEPDLNALMARLSPVDLVLAEGFKKEAHPKIETHRAQSGQALIAPGDPTIRAIASDVTLTAHVPVFGLDDVAGIADFISREVRL